MTYNDAMKLANEAHAGQYRDISGEPYIYHPLRVAENFCGRELLRVCAVLHDVIEDTNVTAAHLAYHGLRDEGLQILDLLTRDPKMTYLDYVLRIKLNPFATEIKLADLRDNLRDSPPGSRRDKYLMAEYILNLPSNLARCQGWYGPCTNTNAVRFHMGTLYENPEANWVTLCPECREACEAHWKEMWREAGREI
jgi:(p)ppGpp synthase/HD superfamily hydrolase